LCTGKHTEVVLTRGCGLHTVVGISLDQAIGNTLDKFAKTIKTKLSEIDETLLKDQIKHFDLDAELL